MKLGFKIEIGSNIYKLPGRINSQIQLLDQIESNFKDRVPLNYSITFKNSESGKVINLNDQRAFTQLQSYAAENNIKCIKLKVAGSQQNSQIDDTVTNWCKLIDGFCEDQQDNNIIHCNISDDRFPEFAFENFNNGQKEHPFHDSFECDDGFIIPGQQWKNNSNSKAIKLDESAIIFIRSEECPFLIAKDNSKDTENEHLNGKNTEHDHQIQLQQSVQTKNKILEQTEPHLQNCAFEQGQKFRNLCSPLSNQCVSNSSSQPFPSHLLPLKQKFSSLDPPIRSNKLPNRHSLNHVKSPSKLTSSVYFDQGNQSTADHSQGSFVSLNASNLSTKNPLPRPTIIRNHFVDENKVQNKEKQVNLNMNSSQGVNSPCSILTSHSHPFSSAENSPFKRSTLKNKNQQFSLDQFRIDQNQKETKQQAPISLLKAETYQNSPVQCEDNFLTTKYHKNQISALIFKDLQAVEEGNSEIYPQDKQDYQQIEDNKMVCLESQNMDVYQLTCHTANNNFKAKILQSPNRCIQFKQGECISINITLLNTGELRWPQNVKLHCIEGFAEGNNFQIESAQPLSSANLSLNFQVPTGVSVLKNQLRLCYEAEHNNLKYFGPKINFQLEMIEQSINNTNQNEISKDILQHSHPLNFQKNPRVQNGILC